MILDKFNLNDKVAIVTGASRGLGAGMAVGLAEAGADLVVVASSARLQETVEKIEALGAVVLASRLTSSTQKSFLHHRRYPERIRPLGHPGELRRNLRRAPAIEFSEKDWDDVIQINQKATFFLCQAAAREMVKQKKGKIVNVASVLAFQGGIIVPSYTASKSAVAGLTKALANEWAALGINVNAIAPGYMATEMTEALQKNAERAPSILARIPSGRWGSPEDMKGAVVFLASDASEYVQGQVLAIDGGWLGR